MSGQIIRVPPLNEEMVAAIRLFISQYLVQNPQHRGNQPAINFKADENSRRFWESIQNGTSHGEYEALKPFLDKQEFKKVLEIGPGLGRSTIYFNKAFHWEKSKIHLYDSTGEREPAPCVEASAQPEPEIPQHAQSSASCCGSDSPGRPDPQDGQEEEVPAADRGRRLGRAAPRHGQQLAAEGGGASTSSS